MLVDESSPETVAKVDVWAMGVIMYGLVSGNLAALGGFREGLIWKPRA